jgi:hypothetical protein
MSNEWEWEGAGEGLQSPDWCAEMQRRVNIGLSMGWIKPPVSEPVPGPDNSSCEGIGAKKTAVLTPRGKNGGLKDSRLAHINRRKHRHGAA